MSDINQLLERPKACRAILRSNTIATSTELPNVNGFRRLLLLVRHCDYWFAIANPHDAVHAKTIEFASGYMGRLVTTEWVLTEVCDGFAAQRYRRLAASLREDWRNDEALVIIPADHDWFERGLDLYCARPDKAWSLTDCISFEVMREHGVTEALTGDRHFEQARFTPLLA